jgi:hypothetical protein
MKVKIIKIFSGDEPGKHDREMLAEIEYIPGWSKYAPQVIHVPSTDVSLGHNSMLTYASTFDTKTGNLLIEAKYKGQHIFTAMTHYNYLNHYFNIMVSANQWIEFHLDPT